MRDGLVLIFRMGQLQVSWRDMEVTNELDRLFAGCDSGFTRFLYAVEHSRLFPVAPDMAQRKFGVTAAACVFDFPPRLDELLVGTKRNKRQTIGGAVERACFVAPLFPCSGHEIRWEGRCADLLVAFCRYREPSQPAVGFGGE